MARQSSRHGYPRQPPDIKSSGRVPPVHRGDEKGGGARPEEWSGGRPAEEVRGGPAGWPSMPAQLPEEDDEEDEADDPELTEAFAEFEFELGRSAQM